MCLCILYTGVSVPGCTCRAVHDMPGSVQQACCAQLGSDQVLMKQFDIQSSRNMLWAPEIYINMQISFMVLWFLLQKRLDISNSLLSQSLCIGLHIKLNLTVEILTDHDHYTYTW